MMRWVGRLVDVEIKFSLFDASLHASAIDGFFGAIIYFVDRKVVVVRINIKDTQ